MQLALLCEIYFSQSVYNPVKSVFEREHERVHVLVYFPPLSLYRSHLVSVPPLKRFLYACMLQSLCEQQLYLAAGENFAIHPV